MKSSELFKAGKLSEAIQAVSAELRDDPGNKRLRSFLFEMLCFAGDYPRAEKQLDILARESADAHRGSLVYIAALSAEQTRAEQFRAKDYPKPKINGKGGVSAVRGKVNETEFETIADSDPRIGGKLEVFAGDTYMLVPFEHIEAIEMGPPQKLRDLLWIPAQLRTSKQLRQVDMGEVLLPALAPLSSDHPDEAVRLGRMTAWERDVQGDEMLFGQKMLLIDGEELPLLELRKLEITPAAEG